MTGTSGLPSIVQFRGRIRAILERERHGHRRPVVILAIDGVPHDLALSSWRHARIERMRSVFPSTSSTAWLSCLTGLDVDDHGVPGVVFRLARNDDALVNVFEYQGSICPDATTLFDDAAELGYVPFSLAGDLAHLDCAWREALLRGSRRVPSPPVYAGMNHALAPPDPAQTCRQLERAIRDCMRSVPAGAAAMVWCFVDLDLHIHVHGYDEHALHLLSLVERMAMDLASQAVVVAHSDHGLVPTTGDPAIAALLDRLTAIHGCRWGGAGRARWAYPRPGTGQRIRDALARELPPSVLVEDADALFRKDSLSLQRVGEIVLVAQGEQFISSDGYRFEHGSRTDREIDVPLAQWSW